MRLGMKGRRPRIFRRRPGAAGRCEPHMHPSVPTPHSANFSPNVRWVPFIMLCSHPTSNEPPVGCAAYCVSLLGNVPICVHVLFWCPHSNAHNAADISWFLCVLLLLTSLSYNFAIACYCYVWCLHMHEACGGCLANSSLSM